MNVSPSQLALTVERRKALRAVVERILPGDQGPGAAATDAAGGFEGAMLHPFFRGLRPGIEGLLDRLQAQAGQLHGKEFPACTPGEQDEMLRALEQDPNPWTRLLFRSLIGFSLEGFLGDPVHGGNRSFLGWEAIGLQAEQVRSGLCLEAREER
jgi:gluconate 2-dehydrogenase gamma chain